MKHRKRISALFLALCMLLALAGCGKKPTAEDAEAYVNAVLSVLCTGDYDHSVNLVDADELEGTMDEAIEAVLDEVAEGSALSEGTRAAFTEAMHEVMAHAKYTVGEAAATEDGFDVPVIIQPLQVGEKVNEAMSAGIDELMESIDVNTVSEDELNDMLIQIMADAIKGAVAEPEYGEESTVTVHYGLLEDNLYGVGEADGEKIGSMLIDFG